MPARSRVKTKYAGVTYIEVEGPGGTEKVYYIRYRRNGKLIEEKAGRQFRDDMTPARAAGIRTRRIEGRDASNAERRTAARAVKEAEAARWTIKRLWESYLDSKLDLKGRASDVSRFKKYLEPTPLADKEPQEIAPFDVDRLVRKDLKGLSAQTQKHVLALLRRIVLYGVRKQLCLGFTFMLEIPTVDNTVTESLSPDQLSALLRVLETSKDTQGAHIMLMAIYTGMRRGELLKLRWPDIDFEREFITIRNPKGKRSQTIPLNASARGILEAHPRISDYVFVSRNGRPFSDVRKRVNVLKKAAGLPDDFRPLHGLRHQFASMLASSGQVDMYVLQKLLTHKSAVTTQRYAHLRDEALRQASDLAGEIIGRVRESAKK
ncbi:MAG: site-specific integrase [Syntrophorhabdales bacterium]|jgi:integrase